MKKERSCKNCMFPEKAHNGNPEYELMPVCNNFENDIETEIYSEYLEDFDKKVMLNNWFPLTLRDKIFEIVNQQFIKGKKHDENN